MNAITKIAGMRDALLANRVTTTVATAVTATSMTGVGAAASATRESLAMQGVSYASMFGLLASGGSFGVGQIMHKVRVAHINRLFSTGAIDEAQQGARIAASQTQSIRTGLIVLGVSAPLAVGGVAANYAVGRTQRATVDSLREQQQAALPAQKITETAPVQP